MVDYKVSRLDSWGGTGMWSNGRAFREPDGKQGDKKCATDGQRQYTFRVVMVALESQTIYPSTNRRFFNPQLANVTKKETDEEARKLNIEGRSTLSKKKQGGRTADRKK